MLWSRLRRRGFAELPQRRGLPLSATLPNRGPAAIIRTGDFEALRADSADTEHSYLRYGWRRAPPMAAGSVCRRMAALPICINGTAHHLRIGSASRGLAGRWVTVEARMSSF